MLKFLSIRNFVIVDLLELDFSSGFTALTGETGAGKSILIDALLLALGERGDAGMVRNGCEQTEITAEFDMSDLPDLQCWLREQALIGDADVCLLRRIMDTNGRSRGFINGRSATLQQMRKAGEHLINIYGQNAHHSLLRSDSQRDLLDGYAGLTGEVDELVGLFREWKSLLHRCEDYEQRAIAVASERELLLFQRQELEMLNFNLQAWIELQTEYARLSHAAGLLETAQFGMEVLSDNDTACLEQLNALAARLRTGMEFDKSLLNTLTMVESAQNDLQEVVYALRHYPQKVDDDPQKLHEQEQRIAAVVEASRKYRVLPEQLPGALQNIVARLDDLGNDADLAVLSKQKAAAHEQYLSAAKKIGAIRKSAADKLSLEITSAMQTLAMQGGKFAASLKPLVEESAYGLEAIEFLVATNPGFPLQNLAKVASGGELSRISLAIQVATSQASTLPTLIFDEVDSGIGGRVAEIVGALLKRLGLRHQVMCVTHLPQVAALANAQWQVSKSRRNGVTISTIKVLQQAERIEEIARMLGGVNITDTTRKHAAEMFVTGLSMSP